MRAMFTQSDVYYVGMGADQDAARAWVPFDKVLRVAADCSRDA